jgi:hypothetical protein
VPSFRLVALAAAGLTVLTIATPIAAEAAPAEEHCVVDVVGQEDDGRLVLSEPTCYRSFDQAQADATVAPQADGTSLQAFAAAGVIGIHYDGANRTGSSITVSGSGCTGGYVNLSTTWRNRISSTQNFCSPTRFYDGLNLTGAVESTPAGVLNLGALSNRADSIKYG